MTKNKGCWRKIKSFGNQPDKAINYRYEGKAYDYISIFPNQRNMSGKIYDWSVETRFSDKRIKSKSKALSFAKKYMKEHNRC